MVNGRIEATTRVDVGEQADCRPARDDIGSGQGSVVNGVTQRTPALLKRDALPWPRGVAAVVEKGDFAFPEDSRQSREQGGQINPVPDPRIVLKNQGEWNPVVDDFPPKSDVGERAAGFARRNFATKRALNAATWMAAGYALFRLLPLTASMNENGSRVP